MQSWQEDLEDWAFKVLQPEARNSVLRGYAALRKQAGQSSQRPEFIIHRFGTRLKSLLEERGIEADVRYRLKTPYSIWRKSENKDGGVESLFDVYGIRIITETADGAYRALGAVHSEWHAIPGRFKDYISLPKSNGYRSIHTTVSASHGFRVEIQIRTADMHKVAETGIAAHWAYRLGRRDDNPYVPDFSAWLKSLKIDLPDHVSPAEYMDHVKLPLAPDRVFCFTPKGEVVRLPVEATPIDFAYAIPHGHRRQVRRGANQRDDQAAVDGAEERPDGRNRHDQGSADEAGMAGQCQDRPREERHPALGQGDRAHRPARAGEEDLRRYI